MNLIVGCIFIAIGINGLLSDSSSLLNWFLILIGVFTLFSKSKKSSGDDSLFDIDSGSYGDSGGGDGGGD
jgi:hypothetical protein